MSATGSCRLAAAPGPPRPAARQPRRTATRTGRRPLAAQPPPAAARSRRRSCRRAAGPAGEPPAVAPGPPMSSADAEVQVSGSLTEPQAAAVLDLVARAAQADGVAPLSEHGMLHVRYGAGPGGTDLLLRSGGEL